MKTYLTCLLLLPLAAVAGDFINLTFDNPILTGSLTPIVPGGPYRGSTGDLLPGWTVKANGKLLSTLIYSPPLTSSGTPVTVRENTAAQAATPLGKFSLYLDGSPPPFELTGPEIRLSQTGTIPTDAAALRLASGYVQVFANGDKIGEINPVTGPFTIDVARLAGQTVNLEFLVRPGDSIRFDILGFTTVPEPSTYALFGLGAALLWYHRRRCR